jgi:hypothetical protein
LAFNRVNLRNLLDEDPVMLKLRYPILALAIFWSGSVEVEAAFIVEPNGKASDHFTATPATNGNSTLAGAGTLAALGLTPDAASVFGGTEYRFDYTPGTDGDNTTFAPGERRNQFATFIASGLLANFNGRYRVFRVHPETQNVSGGLTTYEILINDVPTGVSQSIDQNLIDIPTGLATGANIGLWELIGEVTVADPTDTITVVQTATNGGFVSMRSGGIMFESIPEPATGVMLALAAVGAVIARRRFAIGMSCHLQFDSRQLPNTDRLSV